MASNNVGYQDTEAIQRTLTELQREGYFNDVPEMVWRSGSAINRILRPSSEIATKENGGLNLQMITKNAFNARASVNPLDDFKKGRTSKSDIIKLRFNYNSETENDFTGIDSTSSVPLFEMKGGPGAVINIVETATNDVFETADYLCSVFAHTDRDAKISQSSGALKAGMDADKNYASAPAHSASDTTGSMLCGTGFAIATFREGVTVDFYSQAGALVVSECTIDYVNFEEKSVSFSLTTESNVANLSTLDTAFGAEATNVYIADTQGRGFKGGLSEVFKETYATETDWFGGKDRSLIGNSHYIPQRSRVGAGTVLLQQTHLDNIAEAMVNRTSGMASDSPVFVAGTKAMRNLRTSIGDSIVTNEDSATRSGDYTIGNLSVGYIAPGVGHVDLVGDPFAREAQAILLYPEDVMKVHAEFRGPMVLSNTEGTGWDRRPNSKIYDMQMTENVAMWWNRINRSAAVFNIQ